MSDWTVVVPGPADSPLASHLAKACGLTVLATPDICDLPREHLVTSAINEFPGSVLVAASYAPRAAYWMLAAAGVHGYRADLPDAAGDGKAIWPLDVSDCNLDEIARRVVAVTGPGAGAGVVRDFYEDLPRLWYPVIDHDRCVHCFECVEFCLFGVYEINGAGKVHVAIPGNCKTGCPACGRVCPTGAIIFPRYPDGGPIGGADEGRVEHAVGNAAREASAGDMKAYLDQNPDEADTKTPNRGLEKAIDDLETFDI